MNSAKNPTPIFPKCPDPKGDPNYCNNNPGCCIRYNGTTVPVGGHPIPPPPHMPAPEYLTLYDDFLITATPSGEFRRLTPEEIDSLRGELEAIDQQYDMGDQEQRGAALLTLFQNYAMPLHQILVGEAFESLNHSPTLQLQRAEILLDLGLTTSALAEAQRIPNDIQPVVGSEYELIGRSYQLQGRILDRMRLSGEARLAFNTGLHFIRMVGTVNAFR